MTDTDIDGLVKRLNWLAASLEADAKSKGIGQGSEGARCSVSAADALQSMQRKVAEEKKLSEAISRDCNATACERNLLRSKVAELEKERDRLILAIADHQTVRSEYVGRIAKLEKENYEWCISNERISNQCCELEAQIAARGEPVAEVIGSDVLPIGGKYVSTVKGKERLSVGAELYVTAPVAVPEWQPIETAPKGEPVIVLVLQHGYEDSAPMGGYQTDSGHWIFDHGEGHAAIGWMPRPAAPTKEQTCNTY